jgi:hypothetical protein
MEVGVQLHAPAAVAPGKNPQNALNMRLDGCQSQSGHVGEEKNLLPLTEI